jgi:ribosomal-protein-alanine N-acetyltransferase
VENPFLSGKRLYLRGLTRKDLRGAMFQWNNDRLVTRYLVRGAFPAELSCMEREYDAMLANPREIELAVAAMADDRHVGVVGLHNINPITHAAEFRVLIGESSYWGQGYGTEATRLTLAYGFELLNLHKIFLGVNSEHTAAVRAYEKSGFVREGELRDEIFRNGRYYHAVRMSILEAEYRKVLDSWDIACEIRQQLPA